jgi:hypothetical protein
VYLTGDVLRSLTYSSSAYTAVVSTFGCLPEGLQHKIKAETYVSVTSSTTVVNWSSRGSRPPSRPVADMLPETKAWFRSPETSTITARTHPIWCHLFSNDSLLESTLSTQSNLRQAATFRPLPSGTGPQTTPLSGLGTRSRKWLEVNLPAPVNPGTAKFRNATPHSGPNGDDPGPRLPYRWEDSRLIFTIVVIVQMRGSAN